MTMKKLLTTIVLTFIAVCSFAQVNKLPIDAGTPRPGFSTRSTSFFMDEKGFNFTWLNDGHDNLAAISYTIYPISGTNGRLRIQALGAADPSDMGNKVYLSAGLAYNLFSAASGFRVDLFAGPKGLNIADGWKWERGRNSFVFGIGLTIPVGH